jgi:uncharacterized protein
MVKESLNSKRIIKEIKEKSKEIKGYEVKKIGLFGSFAKNKQRKKSDIDILVTFEKETFDNYAGLLLLLEKMFRRKIDIVVEKDLHSEFKYLNEIISTIDKIEKSIVGKTFESFTKDSNLFDATLMRIHFIGETIKSIPYSLKRTNKKIK